MQSPFIYDADLSTRTEPTVQFSKDTEAGLELDRTKVTRHDACPPLTPERRIPKVSIENYLKELATIGLSFIHSFAL
jgi:hypothetical protein